ncbi:uncharacterized protein LOC128230153 [Mya arenaria]|uniref:uncharacterized protein LOC128230153 n=1 Tax=Mya arenaria TaxID=6604 RepID=UPI0022E99318|nr:uncharacterized protein LOC128230153 [Mya arenaria]
MAKRGKPSNVIDDIQRPGGDDVLKCPLCLDTFETPRALACLHTFCEPCLKFHITDLKASMRDGKLDKVPCPVCERPSVPPDVLKHPHEMVKDFPLNHFLLPHLEVATPRSRTNNIAHGRKGVSFVQCCGSCTASGRAVEATAYCQDCEDFQCSECVDNHMKMKLLMRHNIVGLDQVTSGHAISKSFDKHNICMHHQTQYARFYCANHDVLVCSDCTVAKHKACDILTELDDLGVQLKQGEKPKQLKDNMKGLQKALGDMVDAIRTNNYGIKRESEEIPKLIQSMKAKVLRLFQYLEEAVDEKIQSFQDEYSNRNSERAFRYKQLLVAIEASTAALETVLEHGTYTQVFFTFHRLKAQLQEYDDLIKVEKDNLTCTTIQLKLDDATESVVNATERLGDVFVENIKPDLAELPPLLFARREESVDDLNLELVKTCHLKKSDPNITRQCISATYMDKKLALIFEVKNRTWFSYTLSLISTEKMEEIHTSELKRDPKHVIALDSNNLAITFPNGGFIEFYLYTAQRKKKPLKFELNHSVKCDIRNAIVAKYSKREFAISTCNYFGTMTHEGVTKQLFYYSVSLRVRETDFWSTQLLVENVVVDLKRKRIYVSANKPNKLYSFTPNGVVMIDLAFDQPITSLDLDPDGNIIVCSGTEIAAKLKQVSANTGKVMRVVVIEMPTPKLTCYNRKGSDFYTVENGKKTRLDKYRYNKNNDEEIFDD